MHHPTMMPILFYWRDDNEREDRRKLTQGHTECHIRGHHLHKKTKTCRRNQDEVDAGWVIII